MLLMVGRPAPAGGLRRFFDVRPGEGLPVLLTFLYIAVVVAAFLLAKPIRNGLFLQAYGPHNLVYVYAAVPLALSLFVPLYTRVDGPVRCAGGDCRDAAVLLRQRVGVLVRVRLAPFPLLPGLFYVWVNCFGVIAPVQAWSFANSLFDTRQAKRLFGLIGSGASLGAITGGILARFLVEPLGGVGQPHAGARRPDPDRRASSCSPRTGALPRKGLMRLGRAVSRPFSETLRRSPPTRTSG